MLELRYIKATGEVTGWCGREQSFGKLDRGRETEAIVILDIPVPLHNCSRYLCDGLSLEELPDDTQPPYSTHIGRITDIDPSKAKPATIVRLWEGRGFTYNCLVTQDIKDQYVEGKINIGDFVLVHFFDDTEKDIAVIMQKIFKTW